MREEMAAEDGSPTEPASEEFTRDELFSVLSNRRRRLALEWLRRRGGTVDVGTLTELVAAAENDVDRAALTDKQRKRTYTSLHQTHLPKLSDAALVEYDRTERVVELTDRAARLDRYVGEGRDEPRWWLLYGLLAAASVLGVLLSAADAVPSPPLSGLGVAAVVTLLFAALALVHAATNRRRASPALPSRSTRDSTPDE